MKPGVVAIFEFATASALSTVVSLMLMLQLLYGACLLWLGASSGALRLVVVGWFDEGDACHTAGGRDQGCYATLCCRQDAKGKVILLVYIEDCM